MEYILFVCPSSAVHVILIVLIPTFNIIDEDHVPDWIVSFKTLIVAWECVEFDEMIIELTSFETWTE